MRYGSLHMLRLRTFARRLSAPSAQVPLNLADRRSRTSKDTPDTPANTVVHLDLHIAVMCCRRSARSKSDTGACIGAVMCCRCRANSGIRGWRASLAGIVALNASGAAPVVGAFMPTSLMLSNAATPTITRTRRIEEQRRSRTSLLPPGYLRRQQPSTIRVGGQTFHASHPLHASLVGLDVGTITAAGSIVISTAAGMWADKHIRFLHGAGTMVTILFASHFSNLSLSPSTHPLYELCWTSLLPASLALLLLSPSVQTDEDDSTSTVTSRTRDAAKEEIGAVSVPFVIGCIGSVIGCLVAFLVSVLGRENTSRAHSHILKGRKHFFWLPGHLLLKPAEAAVAAGCLCASYVGGSANYFSCARIISQSVDIPDYDGASGVLSGTFGSSASDLLIMALYFSTVTASLSSTILQRWFPGRVVASRTTENDSLHPDSNDSAQRKSRESMRRRLLARILLKKRRYRRRAVAAMILVPLSLLIVQVADSVEALSKLPGMGSLAISVLAIGISRLLRGFINHFEARQRHGPVALLSEMNQMSSRLSDICFYMLFASIGSTANLGSAIFQSGWHSASSFIFAAIALLVHIVVIVVGSLGVERLFPSFRFFPLGIDEIAVASNAAIGGPVTAAAVAAGLATEEVSSQSRRKGLILAATTWGIVGYAVATAAGVALCKALLSYLLNSSLI